MPLSAATCLTGVDIVEPQISPDGRWIASVLNGDRGAFLHCIDIGAIHRGPDQQPLRADDLYAETAWSPWPVRSGRSLGGGSFAWLPDSSGVVVVARTGDLWLLTLKGANDSANEPRRLLTWSSDSSEADSHLTDSAGISRVPGPVALPVIDPTGHFVAVTVDQSQVYSVEIATGQCERVDTGDDDFVSDPVWWKGQLHWVVWNVPNMPWDTSVITDAAGERHGSVSCQVQQPQVSRSGQVWGWLDDSSGWLNVQLATGTRASEQYEHGGPSWGERQRSWCFNDEGTKVAYVRNEGGFGRLCCLEIGTGRVVEQGKAIHGQLSWSGDTLVALRTGAKTPTRIVAYDTSGPQWTRHDVLTGAAAIESHYSSGHHSSGHHSSMVEPRLIEAQAPDGAVLFGRLYRSPISRNRVLCWIHGGPTDQWTVTFMPRFLYWLDRGYDILVPDHRGSTGHGRAYTQALRGRWGDLDVADVRCLLTEVLRDRPDTSTALMGSSAGGMTALAFLARYPGVAAAAVVAYPVSDMAALDEVTHRFEAHYNRTLLGTPEQTRQRSSERSPRHLVEAIAATPLLIFHGTEDPVVPITQSESLVAALGNHRATLEYVVFEGEGHGFRLLENKIAEYERTERFLERHLGNETSLK